MNVVEQAYLEILIVAAVIVFLWLCVEIDDEWEGEDGE